MAKLTIYEKGIVEKLGSWVAIWYPSAPKTYGLKFMRDFLEERGAWNKFVTNFYTLEKRKGFIQMFEYIWASKDILNLLQWAFDWSKTSEGKDYWTRLDDELKVFLTKKRNEGYNLKLISTESSANTQIRIPLHSRKVNEPSRSVKSQISTYVAPLYKLPFRVPVTSTTIFNISN